MAIYASVHYSNEKSSEQSKDLKFVSNLVLFHFVYFPVPSQTLSI